jgi:PST family polysaccharide transporter
VGLTAGGRDAGARAGARDAGTAPVRDAVLGGLSILIADSLFIPSALLIATFLARRLGPSLYGLYVLATAIAGWLEWMLSAVIARAAVRQIAASDDWRPAGAAILRILLAISSGAAVVLLALATPFGTLLGETSLAPLLRLAAPSLPLAGLVLAHRFVLIGLGRFHARAVGSALRSISRLALVVALVEAGFGVGGAIVAMIGAAVVELAAVRWFVRPPLVRVGPTPWRELGRLAVPLFAAGIAMRVFERLDLICLQAIGGRTSDTGIYGAAQSLAMLPGFVVTAFTPVLLASVTRLMVAGRREDGQELARQALRGALWLAPLAAAVAGAADAIVLFLFGPEYGPAGWLLSILCIASVGQVMAAVASTLLVAIDRVKTSAAIAVPLVPLAVAGHLVVIPRFGATGAAVVTGVASCAAAGVALLALSRALKVAPPAATVWRVGVLVPVAAILAAVLPGTGVLVVVRMLAVLGLVGAAMVKSGEIRLSSVRALLVGPAGTVSNG